MINQSKTTTKTPTASENFAVVGERHALALPIELEEGAPPFLAHATMAVFSGLIIFLLVWANIAKVRELSIATGEIAPYGWTREISHYEGGIVDKILVRPGQSVEAGEALVRLRVENADGELRRFEVRRANLNVKAERLDAQHAQRTPNFSAFTKRWPSLVGEQQSIFDSATTQHNAEMAKYVEREESARAELRKTSASLKADRKLLIYAAEQLAIQESLITDGYTSRQSYLQAKSRRTEAEAKVAISLSQHDQAKGALSTALADRESAYATYKAELAEAHSAVIAELAELEKTYATLKDRSERLTIRAPIAGVVNDVIVEGRGDVVGPGGGVVEITPVGAEMIAEVRIHPNDIGHIAVGQATDIVVSTFDPNRYGKVEGVVTHISADTVADDRTGEGYYIGYVTLGSQDIGQGARLRALSPGMEVRAEIVTQSRSLMQYMLKPVSRSLDQAFTER